MSITLQPIPGPGFRPTAEMVNSDDPEVRAGQVARLRESLDYILDFIDQISSAGQIVTLGNSVVEERTYGLSSNAGSSALGSRVDHTHGSPGLSSNSPADISVSAANAGTGAAPSRDDHVHFLDTDPSGNAVGTARLINTTSPISGGGNLSADRTITFDQTVDLNNNARVAVRENSGADVGERRRLNLIEGANVALTVTDDAGNEEIDVTIAVTGSVAPTAHNLLSASHGDTVVNSPTRGSIIVANSTPAWDEALLGAANTCVRSDGTDAAFSSGILDNNARVAVGKNSAAATGTRRKVNFIEGSNVTLTVADDAGNEEVDVTIAAASGASVGAGIVSTGNANSDGASVTAARVDHVHKSGPHVYMFVNSSGAGVTPGTTPTAVTTSTPVFGHETVGRKLSFAWAYTGTKTANWRLRDTTNSQTLASGTRAGSFGATLECLEPAFSNLPTSCALVRLEVFDSGAGAGGTYVLSSHVTWMVDP